MFQNQGWKCLRNTRIFLLFVLSFIFTFNTRASRIAVIDSGNDFKHKDLISKVYVNPLEIPNNDRDDDKNGYQDDVSGWNFAESNPELIDYSYKWSFDKDTEKFFNVQLSLMTGSLSEEDRAWIREKVKDPEFMKKLQIFGNWMHGTHVTGITLKEAPNALVLGLKLIPTEVKLPGKKSLAKIFSQNDLKQLGELNDPNDTFGLGDFLFKRGLKTLAEASAKVFSEIGSYVKGANAQVANGSFGTPYEAIKNVVGSIYKTVFRKDASAEELAKYTSYYFEMANLSSSTLFKSSPKTLFVLAAGNDGTDNKLFPTSPANALASNKIVVAATMNNQSLAAFSNFNEELVDIAAPGVGINSTIPMDEFLRVSGTSQAAPYVASVAAALFDINPQLKPEDVKNILMATVDIVPWLKGKVKSGGVVNSVRAKEAARLSLTKSLEKGIQMSLETVGSQISSNKARTLVLREDDKKLLIESFSYLNKSLF
jgi:subtilisin family serine protease